MFVLSKIILMVTDLGIILLALLCVGANLLWTRWRSLGRCITGLALRMPDAACLFFAQMSLDLTRVVFENQSRNTHENAVLTRALVKAKEGERWVLITSAMHMPRAVGTFLKVGWSVIPYPVDYNTEGTGKFWFGFNLRNGLNSIGAGTSEWISLVAYRVLGRTDSLFPAPRAEFAQRSARGPHHRD